MGLETPPLPMAASPLGTGNPPVFKWEVFLSFHIMQPFKEMKFHSQNHPLHELTDNTETKREAVFLSVFRKEIIVNQRSILFNTPCLLFLSFDQRAVLSCSDLLLCFSSQYLAMIILWELMGKLPLPYGLEITPTTLITSGQ